MSTVIDVGGIKVSALNDGEVHLPPMYYPGPRLRRPPGTVAGRWDIPHPRGVLPDSGRGPDRPGGCGPRAVQHPVPRRYCRRGRAHGSAGVDCRRRAAARRAGRSRCRAGRYQHRLPHSSARRLYRVGRPWWCSVLSPCGGHVQRRRVADAARRPRARRARGQEGACGRQGRGVLRPIDAATAELAPGVSAHHSPGHTPGHYVVRVSSNGEAAYLLGDVVHHPLQLNDQGISFLSETQPERALRAREELLTALQGRNVSIGMAHFPGLDFQQITTANGRAWTTAG